MPTASKRTIGPVSGRSGRGSAAGDGEVEIGTERFRVEVVEVSGAELDRIYARQVERMPGFGEYERRLKGGRTIPVLTFRRTG